jgi:hypothetical protein
VHDRLSFLCSLPERRSKIERLTTPSRKEMLISGRIYQFLFDKCRCPTHELVSSGPLKNTNEEVGQLCINELTV